MCRRLSAENTVPNWSGSRTPTKLRVFIDSEAAAALRSSIAFACHGVSGFQRTATRVSRGSEQLQPLCAKLARQRQTQLHFSGMRQIFDQAQIRPSPRQLPLYAEPALRPTSAPESGRCHKSATSNTSCKSLRRRPQIGSGALPMRPRPRHRLRLKEHLNGSAGLSRRKVNVSRPWTARERYWLLMFDMQACWRRSRSPSYTPRGSATLPASTVSLRCG